MEAINNNRKNRVNDSYGERAPNRKNENYSRKDISPNSDDGRKPMTPNKIKQPV